MRSFVGAISLFLVGLGVGFWLVNAQINDSAYNSRDVELIKMQQMEASLRGMERDLLACRTSKNVLIDEKNHHEVVKSSNFDSASHSSENPAVVNDSVATSDALSLRLDYLDEKIEDAPEDLEWKGEIDTSISAVLSEWPGAKQTGVQCSQYICRVEIVSGRADQAEKIIDGLNNIEKIKGERMIQFDNNNSRAVMYIGRDGNTSLASGDGF